MYDIFCIIFYFSSKETWKKIQSSLGPDWKKLTFAVREAGVSRHNGDYLRAPLNPSPQCNRVLWCTKVSGRFITGPPFCREALVSQTANMRVCSPSLGGCREYEAGQNASNVLKCSEKHALTLQTCGAFFLFLKSSPAKELFFMFRCEKKNIAYNLIYIFIYIYLFIYFIFMI